MSSAMMGNKKVLLSCTLVRVGTAGVDPRINGQAV